MLGLGGVGGGGGGGAGLGLDLSAVIQAAVVGLVLFSAAVVAVRRAASRYFVVDAAGFTASYDDHHHHHSSPDYPMLPKGSRREEGLAAGEVSGSGPCAACGGVTTKKCSRCKRVRYWCVYSSFLPCPFRACLGISGMNVKEGYWGGGISIITQIFPKSSSILFHQLDSSISQTSPPGVT
jgi:hypothetical protein